MAKRDLYTAPQKVRTVTGQIDNEPSAEEKLKHVESWYQRNSKNINNILIGAIAIIAGIFAYTRLYKAPKLQKANDAIFRAQTYFSMDSLNWALNGDGSSLGFLKIIDKFGGTPAANLSHYYAGVCFLKMGDYASAEKHLKEFDGKGTMVSKVAKGALGDAYMEQNKMSEAVSAYLDASSDDNNLLLSPLYMERAAIAYEMQNKNEEAINTYKKILEKFPSSQQSNNVKKNLARLGVYE